ncbi:midkine a [Gasterosteus aculeatus]|uniref:midkine a n=1 Tax=Gasterosteus aculeatus aculeatus TaxID=481459 RepID=UPI001A995B75|nr:midkine a [Gasterosteus aculeatus aculeatus]XP_040038467.1 midkine a [Gasterosteus aculeatus aculeatus]
MRAAMLLLVITLIAVESVAGGKNKKEKNKPSQSGSECTNWRYGNCVPSNGDCGLGFREGSCEQQNQRMKCRIPCNWKKKFGADCKYRFDSWGECDPSSGLRTRMGTLKKALFNAECQPSISASKPCTEKIKTRSKAKKTKGEGN